MLALNEKAIIEPTGGPELLTMPKLTNKLQKKIRTTCSYGLNMVAAYLKRPIEALPDEKHIFLTFDDGPHQSYTQELAKLLEQRGHRGTFFLVGKSVTARPDIALDLLKAGHTVGSHSESHYKQWETSGSTILRDYFTGHKTLTDVTGEKSFFFRPPYGYTDWRSELFVRLKGIKLALWNCDSFDWQENADVDSVLENLEGSLVQGNILLFHDAILDNPRAVNRDHTLQSIRIILDRLDEQGLVSKGLPK